MIKHSQKYKAGLVVVLFTAAMLFAACGNAEETALSSSVLDTTDLFNDCDKEQTTDMSEAIPYTLADGEDIQITEEGVYLFTGVASEVSIVVNAGDEDKVQLVLDGATITNTDKPGILVENADKVYVTTVGDSMLTVSENFAVDESAAIYSSDDLILNGTAMLTVHSSDEGVRSKDDLKITGGTYVVDAGSSALKANDSIVIDDGSFTLKAGTDGLHAENNKDDTLGYIYIADGTFDIQCKDDAIHGQSVVQIDGGNIHLNAREGIEGTYVQINGGDLTIHADDDAINAGQKSDAYDVTLEITGGSLKLEASSATSDALDSNGDLLISGGTIDIIASSALDYEGIGKKTGGTLRFNGEEITKLTPSNG